MGRRQDDPVLYDYYRKLDEEYDRRRREIDMGLIRIRADIAATDARIAAADRAQRRVAARRDAERTRDRLEHEFRETGHFRESDCRQWADRTWRIGRTAADDQTEVERLREDFRTAADGYQRDLRRIATMLGFQLPEQTSPRTPLDELLLPFVRPIPLPARAAGPDLHTLRDQIARCAQLRHQTRQIWLQELTPDSRMRGLWLFEVPVDVVRRLQQKVALEARSAAQEASLIDGSLVLLRSYLQSDTG
jgi:hypothetical protein